MQVQYIPTLTNNLTIMNQSLGIEAAPQVHRQGQQAILIKTPSEYVSKFNRIDMTRFPVPFYQSLTVSHEAENDVLAVHKLVNPSLPLD